MLRRPGRPKAGAMRAKWRIVVSFTAVLATHELGSTYHSFSQYDNERKARRTAGRPKAMRGSRGRPARPGSRGSDALKVAGSTWASDCAALADINLVQRWLRVLKHWHSRQYNHELIRRRPTVSRSAATSVNLGGRPCQLICSRFAILRPHRRWLSGWHCCRQRATHLRKTINAGFAPAMFFDFARRKFRVWSASPPACTSSGPV